MEEEIEEQEDIIVFKNYSRAKKILIIIIKVLLLFLFPIVVALLDHFIF